MTDAWRNVQIIDVLGLPTRCRLALHHMKTDLGEPNTSPPTLGGLAVMSRQELLRYPNVGRNCVHALETVLIRALRGEDVTAPMVSLEEEARRKLAKETP